ncbi:MAG: hypothetical protein JWQ52_740 [Phenylobacterium sp.]|jgi:hypothetical protein|nr:hypothetical protein [Phenylobacterium sp.]
MSFSGGCQCGAVRFGVDGELGRASICHCRMCQKAFGSAFGPLVSVKVARLAWTRGEPKRFRSSERILRGFCADCGTPLTYEWSAETIDLAIGAFDEAARIVPVLQLAANRALPWVAHIADLPQPSPEELARQAPLYSNVRSFQHPDHDTDAWPAG